jgi:hypothetical protein
MWYKQQYPEFANSSRFGIMMMENKTYLINK